MDEARRQNFEQVNDRLKEIVDLVSSDDVDLDDALDLFEEAVRLGVQASSLLEEDIVADPDAVNRAEPEADSPAEAGGPAQ